MINLSPNTILNISGRLIFYSAVLTAVWLSYLFANFDSSQDNVAITATLTLFMIELFGLGFIGGYNLGRDEDNEEAK